VNFDLSSALAAIRPGRPLVITDADGVVLRFTGGLERYLQTQGFYLELTGYRLLGAVKRQDDHAPLLDVEVLALVEEFRRELDDLEAVDGACEALRALAEVANIVVLSNVNESQAVARLRNMAALGLDFPLIANDAGQGHAGGKGAAVKTLAARTGARTFFIDDLPSNLADVAKAAPEVLLIHLVESPALKKLLGSEFHAHCHAENWAEAGAFILGHLE
jgi:hypothetical protein